MFPYKINFVDSDPSPAVETQIQSHLEDLFEHHDRITSAEVMVRIPHKRHNRKFFHVHIRLDLPGTHLVVSRDSEDDDSHMDPTKAIHDAFDKMTRQLEDYVSKRSDSVKRA